MSIFITLLAFSENTVIVDSKIAILTASILAAVIGLLYLKRVSGGDQSSSAEE
jgi:NhaA family Na+:H+ antiporter